MHRRSELPPDPAVKRPSLGKAAVFGLLCLVSGSPALAQQPVGADSVARDSTRVRQLLEINVTVTRSPEPLQRVPYVVGVLDKSELQRGQLTLGLDERLPLPSLPPFPAPALPAQSSDTGSRSIATRVLPSRRSLRAA